MSSKAGSEQLNGRVPIWEVRVLPSLQLITNKSIIMYTEEELQDMEKEDLISIIIDLQDELECAHEINED